MRFDFTNDHTVKLNCISDRTTRNKTIVGIDVDVEQKDQRKRTITIFTNEGRFFEHQFLSSFNLQLVLIKTKITSEVFPNDEKKTTGFCKLNIFHIFWIVFLVKIMSQSGWFY